MQPQTILIVEDEADLLEVLQFNLSREGYRVIASTAGDDGLQRARQAAPDLVILDLMLPGMDGIEVCRRLRADPITQSIPIIMVTAKGEESDVILGLGVGADDYVVKPFSPKELIARVRAVLRRSPARTAGAMDERLLIDGIVIDVTRHEVMIDGQRVDFTPTELRLLHVLASNLGRVLTRDQLLSRVIGAKAFVVDRNIDVHIRAIRKKLGTHRGLLQTVRGVGYRFTERRS
jgi:two-component system phosphate regulon response regulator PhoB